MDLKIKYITRLGPEEVAALTSNPKGDGTLHYKYMPKTGEWGSADISYAVLTPSDHTNTVVKEMWRGEGTVQFHEATWEDLPTMFHIVNALRALGIKEYRGAMIVKSVGGKDLSDQGILR